jgi:hypothetical protein
MASKIDYFTALSHAVAGLERDSYAARGAIYDREHKALMRRLFSADPPHSDAEIGQEQQAFRDAVRHIEFGAYEDDDQGRNEPSGRNEPTRPAPVLIPEREPSNVIEVVPPLPPRRVEREAALPPERSPAVAQRRPLRDPPQWAQRKSAVTAGQIESALEAALNGAPEDTPSREQAAEIALLVQPPRRSVASRVVGRTLFAALVLGVGMVVYGLISGQIEVPWLNKLMGSRTSVASPGKLAPQPVILFDGTRPDLNGVKFDGQATWQLRTETEEGRQVPVVQIDMSVPGRKVNLMILLRRQPAGSTMSHLFEMRFLQDNKEPDADISNIAGVVMTTAEMTRPALLIGRVVSVTPGVFLYGLSSQETERDRNLQNLKDMAWLGIPITYRNGASGVLTFAKGTEGERVLNEAIRQWAAR